MNHDELLTTDFEMLLSIDVNNDNVGDYYPTCDSITSLTELPLASPGPDFLQDTVLFSEDKNNDKSNEIRHATANKEVLSTRKIKRTSKGKDINMCLNQSDQPKPQSDDSDDVIEIQNPKINEVQNYLATTIEPKTVPLLQTTQFSPQRSHKRIILQRQNATMKN